MSDTASEREAMFAPDKLLHIAGQVSVIAVLKFWACVLDGVRDVQKDTGDGSALSGDEVVYLGTAMARLVAADAPDIDDVIARMKQGDVDTGQTTDLSFLVKPARGAAGKPAQKGKVGEKNATN